MARYRGTGAWVSNPSGLISHCLGHPFQCTLCCLTCLTFKTLEFIELLDMVPGAPMASLSLPISVGSAVLLLLLVPLITMRATIRGPLLGDLQVTTTHHRVGARGWKLVAKPSTSSFAIAFWNEERKHPAWNAAAFIAEQPSAGVTPLLAHELHMLKSHHHPWTSPSHHGVIVEGSLVQ